jgi:acetoin utilization deacetylase AcuC-like enzyme
MTNKTRQRDEEDDVTARSREAKRSSEARARNKDTQIAQMHTTMLQHQEQMRLHQQEMLRQRNEMANMARYQENGNNDVNVGQQVLDAAGLAFGDATIPENFNLVGYDALSHDYGSPRGNEMDADYL